MAPYILGSALALFALYWLFNQRSLFHLSVRGGRVLVVQGRIPIGLLNDFREVLKHTSRASVRAFAGEHHARLSISGVDEGIAQRLRNVFGLCPVARLRSSSPIAKPNLGQVLGVAWLAWLLSPPRS